MNFRSGLKDYELVSVLGILLDNAFEALEKVEDKLVALTIETEGNLSVLTVENRSEFIKNDIIQRMFKKGFSTKAEFGRGYGLSNLLNIVRKNRGNVRIFNEGKKGENYLVIKIELPIPT